MGHTDVVPVNPDGLVTRSRSAASSIADGGEVWGRGAIDMLNITSSMAVAFRRLADEGFRPRGTLIYFGVADEEAGGEWGAEYMVEHHWDAIGADYVLTETGGWSQSATTACAASPSASPRRASAGCASGSTARPATARCRTAPTTPSSPRPRSCAASRPTGRQPQLDDLWRPRVDAMDLPDDVRAALIDPARIDDAIASLEPVLARHRPRLLAHDAVAQRRARRPEDQHHPRRRRHRRRHPHRARRDARRRRWPPRRRARRPRRRCRRQHAAGVDATRSRHRQRRCGTRSPHAPRPPIPAPTCLPGLMVGGTDARFYRERGCGRLRRRRCSRPDDDARVVRQRFHGNDERIDVDSLAPVDRALVRRRQGSRRLTPTSAVVVEVLLHVPAARRHVEPRARAFVTACSTSASAAPVPREPGST